MSKFHAYIELEETDSHYVLVDGGSRNVTKLNDTVVAAGEEGALHDGDLVKFADFEFFFTLASRLYAEIRAYIVPVDNTLSSIPCAPKEIQ
jgi:hypothetical protein